MNSSSSVVFQVSDVRSVKRYNNNKSSILIFGRTAVDAVTGDDKSVVVVVENYQPLVYVAACDRHKLSFNPNSATFAADIVRRTRGFGYHEEEEFLQLRYDDKKMNSSKELLFDEDMPRELSFMIEHGDVRPCDWIEVATDKQKTSKDAKSTCDIEVVLYNNTHVNITRVESPPQPMARFRVLAFDIECAGREDVFPDPAIDPIISIVSLVDDMCNDRTPRSYVAMTYRGVDRTKLDKIEENGKKLEVEIYEDEQEMLEQWFNYIVERTDVDVITGYNSTEFDLPYIAKRYHEISDQWPVLGKMVDEKSSIYELRGRFKGTKAAQLSMLGRVDLDMLTVIRDGHKLRSYKITPVVNEFMSHRDRFEFDVYRPIKYFKVLGLRPEDVDKHVLMSRCGEVIDIDDPNTTLQPADGPYYLHFPRKIEYIKTLFVFVYDRKPCDESLQGKKELLDFYVARYAKPDETKIDLPYHLITPYWNENDEKRAEILEYNARDTVLVMRMFHKLLVGVKMVEMAKVTGVTLETLIKRKQSVRCESLLFRKFIKCGFVIPSQALVHVYGADNNDDDYDDEDDNDDDDEDDDDDEEPAIKKRKVEKKNKTTKKDYVGATVIEPKRGFYKIPVATLDFASLYPSIMRTKNMCPTTYVEEGNPHYKTLPEDRYYVIPTVGHRFVKQSTRRGVLPLILAELGQRRGEAKKAMRQEPDEFKKAIWDGRQLALKLSMNALYGYFGAKFSRLRCRAIAESVTAFGRFGLELTEEETKKHTLGSEIVYGDTDSVFVLFRKNNLSVAEAIELGKSACKKVNEAFEYLSEESVMRLEFEKVFQPLDLVNKKRYAGAYWTKPDFWDMIYSRGLENVRRDSCVLAPELMEVVLYLILGQNDIEAAKNIIRVVVQRLYMCEIDIDRLVLSKEYVKENYATPQMHIAVVEKMRKRNKLTAPRLKERIPFVVMPRTVEKTKPSELSEDPEYVKKNGMYPDARYYVEKQLRKPLTRVLKHIIGESACDELFMGAHTMKRRRPPPSNTQGLMKFFNKK